MGTERLEAFSDGILAILITIMGLELEIPRQTTLRALVPMLPVLLTYVLSFIYLGIYWSNHHPLLQTVERVSGGMLWANLHLLFWLSLIPFTTGWMGENHFASVPTAFYGVVLLMAALAWWILQQRILALQGEESLLSRAIGGDWKGKLSIAALPARHPRGRPCPPGVTCPVRPGGAAVAHPGPAHRACPGRRRRGRVAPPRPRAAPGPHRRLLLESPSRPSGPQAASS